MIARISVASLILVLGLNDGFASAPKIQFVYFGSSGCGISKNKELQTALRPAIAAIKSATESRGWSFESIAVTVDEDKEIGKAYLESAFPDFDVRHCDGAGFGSALFQDLVMRRPAIQDSVPEQLEGVPYLVILKVMDDKVILERYVSGMIIKFLQAAASPDIESRTKRLDRLLDRADRPTAPSHPQ